MRNAGRHPIYNLTQDPRSIDSRGPIFHIPRFWSFQPYNDTNTRRLYAHANPFLDIISRLFILFFLAFLPLRFQVSS